MAKSKKNKTTNTKVGAPDHFVGFKKKFLDTQAILYQQALDDANGKKKTSEFYDKVTRDFIAKFGNETDVTRDPAEDPPDPDPESPPTEYLSQEAADEASDRFKKLRTVS